MSQDGFANEDGEQMTPELLLLQERQRASEWPKVTASFLDMSSLKIQCDIYREQGIIDGSGFL